MVKSKLSTFIFDGLEKNSYLRELYQRLLKEYGAKLFSTQNKEENVDSDLLRFADLLSYSVDNDKADFHKNIAQSIVSILAFLHPDNKEVAFYRERVLKNVKNYAVLSSGIDRKSEQTFSGDYLMHYFLEEYRKDSLKIPGSENLKFIGPQKEVFEKLDSDYISFSAPTSMGKSFLMRMFMKSKIKDGEKRDFALVVPTKALISETYIKVINDLQSELAEHNYRVIRSVNEIQGEDNYSRIFVMTPERLLYLLLSGVKYNLGYVFIDESQRITANDTRSTFYYQIVDLLQKEDPAPLIAFASPNIPNPQIYLRLLSEEKKKLSKRIAFSPVNQVYFTIDYSEKKIKCFNNLDGTFFEVGSFISSDLLDIVLFFSKKPIENQSLIYCNKTSDAISYALEMSKKVDFKDDPILNKLSTKISKEIHSDYYLADLVKKGIAFHVGYLPEGIRNDIEEAYRLKHINTIFCTSTLMEGVNLPASNLFVTSTKIGSKKYNQIDFYNLSGRIGRLEYATMGNIFLVINEEKDFSQFISLLTKNVPEQKLSIDAVVTRSNVEKIKKSLMKGDIALKELDNATTVAKYNTLRKYTLIFLRNLQNDTRGVVRETFEHFITYEEEQRILKVLGNLYPGQKVDKDINVSLDQNKAIRKLIDTGEAFPEITANGPGYPETLSFLEKMADAYNWEQYEPNDLGKKSDGEYKQLRWYTVILTQWISGYGLSNILKRAIDYKKNNPHNALWIEGNYEDYKGTRNQNNIIINDTLKVLQRQILFKLSNYFLKYAKEYKRYHQLDNLQNDWYEFVEYGTSNGLRIWLQKIGYSREATSFIEENPKYYFIKDGKYFLNAELKKLDNDIGAQTVRISFNRPELFIEK